MPPFGGLRLSRILGDEPEVTRREAKRGVEGGGEGSGAMALMGDDCSFAAALEWPFAGGDNADANGKP